MKLVVIGGTGFLGTALLQKAVQLGWTTYSISRTPIAESLKISSVTYLYGDLTSDPTLKSAFIQISPHYIINCSGTIDHSCDIQSNLQTFKSHFFLVKALLDISLSLPNIRRVIQTGSSEEYGLAPSPQKEILSCSPTTPYGLSKLLASQLSVSYNHLYALPTVVVRPYLIYGPNQKPPRLVPYIIERLKSHQPVTLGRSDVSRDFLYISDAVDAYLRLLECDSCCGHIFNLGSGIPCTIETVVSHIVKYFPDAQVNFSTSPHRIGQNDSLYPNVSNLFNHFQWTPAIPLPTGIKHMVDYSMRA